MYSTPSTLCMRLRSSSTEFRNGDLEFDVDGSTGTFEANIRDSKNELTTSSTKQVQREGRMWMLVIGHTTVRVDTASCD